MRTTKECANLIAKTIKEIRSNKVITKSLVKKTAKKYDISFTQVMRVGGWDNLYAYELK